MLQTAWNNTPKLLYCIIQKDTHQFGDMKMTTTTIAIIIVETMYLVLDS